MSLSHPVLALCQWWRVVATLVLACGVPPLLASPSVRFALTTLPAQPLAAILDAAQRGEGDLVSSLRPTPERAAYLAFTAPYVQVPAVRVHQMHGLQVVQAIGFDYPLSFAHRKTLTPLGQQLDAALLKLDLQTLGLITDRWIGAEALHFEDPRRTRLRWAGLAVATLALLVLAGGRLTRWRGRSAV